MCVRDVEKPGPWGHEEVSVLRNVLGPLRDSEQILVQGT